jgi:hypothetical protein
MEPPYVGCYEVQGEGRGEGGRKTILLLFLLLALALSACDKAPYSSPTASRDTNAYFKAISPAAPTTVDASRLDQVTAALEGETLVITRPEATSSSEPNDGYSHVLTRLAAGEKLAGDGATFEMVAFSVRGPGISPVPTNGNRQVPVDFFAPDGKSLSQEELKQLGFRDWQLKEYVDESPSSVGDLFPRVKVWFGSRQQPPGYINPVGCFDAQTKYLMDSGYGYSQISSNDFGYVELRPPVWRAVPMDLVMDVELDGKVVVQTNATAGMTVSVPGGFVRLVGVWDGSLWWSSPSGSLAGTETSRLTLRKAEGKAQAMGVLMTEPPELAVHYALLDGQGKVLDGGRGGSSGGIKLIGVQGRAEDVKSVRFTVHTNHHRVVLRIPPLPNLPGSQQNYANLFEVPVPLMEFRRDYELREFIGGMTQMKFRYSSLDGPMPTNLFPMMLTNVTPAEILALYRRNITNTLTVVMDEKKQEIRVEPTMLEKAKRWVKQKLKL